MVTTKRRMGKLLARVFSFAVLAIFCSVLSARLNARVFFGLRSRGTYFLPLHSFRIRLLLLVVDGQHARNRLPDDLMTFILASFDAAPPATFATRSWDSSLFISSRSFRSSLEVFKRSS
ncbi:unnamed protein product [Prorocentrum cordatum]|uniref:Secreted protein n=1 Tax=Prorocentrum cordatum TaxID=2364126 RepID=A0ABN9WD39_9DINO|nr:unnamed protein product [Polarella glacialis]